MKRCGSDINLNTEEYKAGTYELQVNTEYIQIAGANSKSTHTTRSEILQFYAGETCSIT